MQDIFLWVSVKHLCGFPQLTMNFILLTFTGFEVFLRKVNLYLI